MNKSIRMAVILLLISLVAAGPALAAIRVGDEAPDFELPALTGAPGTVSLHKFRDRVVLVNIWATWCPACRNEMPRFIKLQEELGSKGFTFIAVSVDRDRRPALEFMDKLGEGRGMVSLWDGESRIVRLYGSRGMPASFLLDRDGNVLRVYVGEISEGLIPDLRADIERALAR